MMLKWFSIGDVTSHECLCGAAMRGGEKQNAGEISGRALGNEIFKGQVNPWKTAMLESNASGRKAGWRSPGALHRLWFSGFGCDH